MKVSDPAFSISNPYVKCVPGRRLRKPSPSCLRNASKTTQRAGMFTPIANVSVAKSTLGSRKHQKRLGKIYYEKKLQKKRQGK